MFNAWKKYGQETLLLRFIELYDLPVNLYLCTFYIPVSTVTSFILLNDKEYFVTVFGRWWLSLVSFVGMRGLFIPTYHVRKSLLDGNPSLALDLIAHQSYTNRGTALYLTWQYSTELFCYIYDPRAWILFRIIILEQNIFIENINTI